MTPKQYVKSKRLLKEMEAFLNSNEVTLDAISRCFSAGIVSFELKPEALDTTEDIVSSSLEIFENHKKTVNCLIECCFAAFLLKKAVRDYEEKIKLN